MGCSILRHKSKWSLLLLFVISANCEKHPLWSYMGKFMQGSLDRIDSSGKQVKSFYTVGPQINHGQAGNIYLAWDYLEGKVVAVKFAKQKSLDLTNGANFLTKAKGFDGIVTIIDFIVGEQGIVMELLGASLLDLFQPDRTGDSDATESVASSIPSTPRSTFSPSSSFTFSPRSSFTFSPRSSLTYPLTSSFTTSPPQTFSPTPSSSTTPRRPVYSLSPQNEDSQADANLVARPASPSEEPTSNEEKAQLDPTSLSRLQLISPHASFTYGQQFPADTVCYIARQVIPILEYMHIDLDAAHGDLYMQNIVTGDPYKGKDDKLKLVDLDKVEQGAVQTKLLDLALFGGVLMTLLGQPCHWLSTTAEIIPFMHKHISQLPNVPVDFQETMQNYLTLLENAVNETSAVDYVKLLNIFKEPTFPPEWFWKTERCLYIGNKKFENVRVINSDETKEIQINLTIEELKKRVPNASNEKLYIHTVHKAGNFDELPPFDPTDIYNWFEVETPEPVEGEEEQPATFKFSKISEPEDIYVKYKASKTSDELTNNAARLWLGDDGKSGKILIQSSTEPIFINEQSGVHALINYINADGFKYLQNCVREKNTPKDEIVLKFTNADFN